MKKFKKKFKFIFIYILGAMGLWMFLHSSSNSHNHLSEEKISPAGIILTENSASINILDNEYKLKTDIFHPESRIYYYLYLICPDEGRMLALLESKI